MSIAGSFAIRVIANSNSSTCSAVGLERLKVDLAPCGRGGVGECRHGASGADKRPESS